MKDDLERCFCVVNVSSVVLLYNVVDRLCCREWFCFDRYQSWLWPLFAAKKELVGSFEISAPMYQIIQRHNSPSISLSVCLSLTLNLLHPLTVSFQSISDPVTTASLSFYPEGLCADLLSGCSLLKWLLFSPCQSGGWQVVPRSGLHYPGCDSLRSHRKVCLSIQP